MEFCKGELVVCTAGREKERLTCVLALDEKYVYLCDGKERKFENPKRKNPKHVTKTDRVIADSMFVTDRALRKALSKEV